MRSTHLRSLPITSIPFSVEPIISDTEYASLIDKEVRFESKCINNIRGSVVYSLYMTGSCRNKSFLLVTLRGASSSQKFSV